MRKFHSIALALIATLAVSCVGEMLEYPVESEIEEGLVEKTYEVSFEDNLSTRSIISGNTPLWKIGDRVSIYDPIKVKARTFRVVSVRNGKAKLSGTISDGEFPFSAVYPAECVSSWKSITEPVYSVPTTQTISSGSAISSSVLVSRAYSETNSGNIIFNNEVSLVQFKVDTEGISKVEFTLGDSKTYTVDASSGTLEKDKTYYLAVEPGTYSSVKTVCTTEFDITYTKSSSNVLNAKKNGQTRLGVVSDGVKHINYELKQTGTIDGIEGFLMHEDIHALEDETAQEAYEKLSGYLENIYETYIPSYEETATTYYFTYKSIDPQGKPVTLSAFLIYPSGTLNGIVLADHYSITHRNDCPTKKLQYEAAFCWKGYAVVMSDYYGFGASADYPQAYMNSAVTGRGDIDALNATRQILTDQGKAFGSQVINVGYSQGGHSVIADVKYASEHPEFGVRFTRSFAGGGPYDMEYTWGEIIKGGCNDVTVYVLVSIVSFIANGDLDVTYSDVFQGTYATTIPQMILSKNYSSAAILRAVGNDLSAVLNADIVNQTGETYEKIMAKCRENSLCGTEWTASACPGGVYLYHSKNDDFIPYENMTRLQTLLGSDCAKAVELEELYDDNFGLRYKAFSDNSAYYALRIGKEFLDIDTMNHYYGAIGYAGGVILNDWPN